MALAAKQVVDALAALLAPQAGMGAGGVKTNRDWPWAEGDLPACRVFASDEGVEPATLGTQINRHSLAVDVQYSARAAADLEATLAALAAAGQTLLFAGTPPYGLELTGLSREKGTEGEAAVGRITLQLRTTFFVAPGAPETIL